MLIGRLYRIICYIPVQCRVWKRQRTVCIYIDKNLKPPRTWTIFCLSITMAAVYMALGTVFYYYFKYYIYVVLSACSENRKRQLSLARRTRKTSVCSWLMFTVQFELQVAAFRVVHCDLSCSYNNKGPHFCVYCCTRRIHILNYPKVKCRMKNSSLGLHFTDFNLSIDVVKNI